MRGDSSAASHFPERAVEAIGRRLTRHSTWNAALLVLPPLAVFFYAVGALFLAGVVGVEVLIFFGAAVFGLFLVVVLHPRTTLPQRKQLGRMIDERVGGAEHFVTLATIDRYCCSPPLLHRLRRQAAQLLHRLNLRRDFPYRMNRASLLSLGLSLLAIVLVHWLLPYPVRSVPGPIPTGKLSTAAQGSSRQGLGGIARGLERVAGLMRDQITQMPALSEWVQELEEQLGGNRSGEEQKTGGSEQGKGKQQTGEGSMADNPGEGDGEGDAGKGDGADEGEPSAKEAQGLEQGKTSRGGQQREGKLAGTEPQDRGDGERPGENDLQAKNETSRPKGSGGNRRRSEEIPEGDAPERFYRPGENREAGLKGSRFVSVELPETVASAGTEVSSRSGAEGSSARGVPFPVKNIPLAPPRETGVVEAEQRVPLEYENLIR